MLYHKTFLSKQSEEWVVFIHGAGGSSSLFFKQIREFRKHFNILLLDLRGHGKSQNFLDVEGREYTFKLVSEDIIKVMNHLNIEKAHFLGVSLGTIIIRQLAETHPERMLSMVMGGAVMKLNLRFKFLITLSNVVKKIIPFMWLYKILAWILMPRDRHKESRILFINEAKKIYQKEFYRWFKLTKETNKLLLTFEENKTNIPSLFIMGKEDYMFRLGVEDYVKNSPNSTIEVLEDCGHVCNVDQPVKFNDLSINFIKRYSIT